MHPKRLLVLLLVAAALLSARCSEEHDHSHEEDSHGHDHAGHSHGITQEDYGERGGRFSGEQRQSPLAAAAAAQRARRPLNIVRADAALARGEDPCAAEDLLSYDLPLHIGAVFILLGVSLAGSLGPIALSLGGGKAGSRRSSVISTAITLGSLFGGWCGGVAAGWWRHVQQPTAGGAPWPTAA